MRTKWILYFHGNWYVMLIIFHIIRVIGINHEPLSDLYCNFKTVINALNGHVSIFFRIQNSLFLAFDNFFLILNKAFFQTWPVSEKNWSMLSYSVMTTKEKKIKMIRKIMGSVTCNSSLTKISGLERLWYCNGFSNIFCIFQFIYISDKYLKTSKKNNFE